jgi:peptide/nickel transport system permease protein
MLRYLVRRLLLTIPVLLGVATLVFALIHLVPGDPAQSMLGDGASPEEVEKLRHALGLDKPLVEQYLTFMTGLARGDLGSSFRYGTPVAREIRDRLFRTFQLAIAAMLVAVAIAIPLGILAAVFRGTAIDHAAMTLALISGWARCSPSCSRFTWDGCLFQAQVA